MNLFLFRRAYSQIVQHVNEAKKRMKAELRPKGVAGMKRIAFTNQKGGVGKTTLTRELGILFSTLGLKVLLVDCDSQANLTRSLGVEPGGLFEAVTDGEVSLYTLSETLSLLGGSVKLALLEKRLLGEVDAYTRFAELFQREEFAGFDLVLLDTPPSLGVLTLNALSCADSIVIPMNPSLYSMQGANDLMETVAKVRKSLNPSLSILGVVVNAFDSVPIITRQIRDEIREAFGDRVFSTVLSKSIRLEEAIAAKKGLAELGRTKVRDELEALGDEFLSRLSMKPEVVRDGD